MISVGRKGIDKTIKSDLLRVTCLIEETAVRGKFVALPQLMAERPTRLGGRGGRALGEGGIAIVERATGLSRTTHPRRTPRRRHGGRRRGRAAEGAARALMRPPRALSRRSRPAWIR
jgi:hypothetical protein